MPRKQHDYHFIYKTVNLVNNKFYIGMHSTSNLEDGYIGSGKRLWYSIKKHGRENFKMEILEFLPDRNSLKEREKEIVNSDLLKEELCMNLKIGGEGGGFTLEQVKKGGYIAGNILKNKIINDPEFRLLHIEKFKINCSKKFNDKNSETYKKWLASSRFVSNHSEETKKLIGEKNSISQKGERNSQFGKCWIFHEKLGNKSIKKDELENYINCGWKLGRKMLK
jgi:hypothetical protein